MDTRKKEGIVRNDFLDTLMVLRADSLKKMKDHPEEKEIFSKSRLGYDRKING